MLVMRNLIMLRGSENSQELWSLKSKMDGCFVRRGDKKRILNSLSNNSADATVLYTQNYLSPFDVFEKKYSAI